MMHNTEGKSEIVTHHPQHTQLPHHSQTTSSMSPARRSTNGEGVLSSGASTNNRQQHHQHHHQHPREAPISNIMVTSNECAGCGKRIMDRFLLKALDLFWHEDCLKCGCCDCRLGEVGSTLYTKANLILCKRDYLRLFGNTGYCAACSKVIPAFEMVMRARNNVYHLECFACQQCNHRFCVGDRFYLCENKILCEYDYEERMVFANMACSPGNLALLRSSQDSKVSTNNGGGGNSNSVVISSSSAASVSMTNNVANSTSSSGTNKFQPISPSPVVVPPSPLHSHHHHHPVSIVPRPIT